MEYVTDKAVNAACAYYLRKYPEAKVLAKRYENSFIVQADEAVFIANVTVSYGDEFSDNDQTQAAAEKQFINWLSDNPEAIPAGSTICFDHMALRIYDNDTMALIRRHKNCFGK